jgi:hypothetical protein
MAQDWFEIASLILLGAYITAMLYTGNMLLGGQT